MSAATRCTRRSSDRCGSVRGAAPGVGPLLPGPAGSAVDYYLDGVRVAHVDRVGVPLDVQDRPYTGIHPSLGPGEDLTTQLDSVVIGHGLFSLLDAFPFQHPEAPELAVSIPVSERIFGQGAVGSFDDFTVRTTPAG